MSKRRHVAELWREISKIIGPNVDAKTRGEMRRMFYTGGNEVFTRIFMTPPDSRVAAISDIFDEFKDWSEELRKWVEQERAAKAKATSVE